MGARKREDVRPAHEWLRPILALRGGCPYSPPTGDAHRP